MPPQPPPKRKEKKEKNEINSPPRIEQTVPKIQ